MMNWIVSNRLSISLFAPEVVLIFGALLLVLVETVKKLSRRTSFWFSIVVFSVFLATSFRMLGQPTTYGFSDMIVVDELAVFFKIIFGLAALGVAWMTYSSKDLEGYGLSEIYAGMMVISAGLCTMASSVDMLMMILSIEMVSVISYILVGFRKRSRVSSEAGLKYLLFGAVASGTMVFGLSFLFGLVGSSSVLDIRTYFFQLEGISTAPIVLFALMTIMVGIGYKIATFPAHMWCPDVYEGAPLPITTFLSIAPKAAGFAMLSRFLFTVFLKDGSPTELLTFIQWPLVLSLISIVTMTLGNLGAMAQRNLKRLMAYSSIAHAGYLLMGVAAMSTLGLQAIGFYLIAYLLMNLGAFYMIYFAANQLGSEDIDSLKGLAWKSPFFAIVFSIFLFSLIGLPPCAGFIAKFLLFSALIEKELYILAAVGALNAAIALFYYARIMRTMFFDAPTSTQAIRFAGAAKWIVLLLALPTLILGLYWGPFVPNFSMDNSAVSQIVSSLK